MGTKTKLMLAALFLPAVMLGDGLPVSTDWTYAFTLPMLLASGAEDTSHSFHFSFLTSGGPLSYSCCPSSFLSYAEAPKSGYEFAGMGTSFLIAGETKIALDYLHFDGIEGLVPQITFNLTGTDAFWATPGEHIFTVGNASYDSGTRDPPCTKCVVDIIVTPEPSSAILLGTVAAVSVLHRLRRKRQGPAPEEATERDHSPFGDKPGAILSGSVG